MEQGARRQHADTSGSRGLVDEVSFAVAVLGHLDVHFLGAGRLSHLALVDVRLPVAAAHGFTHGWAGDRADAHAVLTLGAVLADDPCAFLCKNHAVTIVFSKYR